MEKYCQSCMMPLTPDVQGTEKDGSPSPDYCSYCYQQGAFTSQQTMEEMIDFCVPATLEHMLDKTEAQVRQMYEEYMPTLKRWKK